MSEKVNAEETVEVIDKELEIQDTAVFPPEFIVEDKKARRLRRGKLTVKLLAAIICIGLFMINGFMMRAAGGYREYAKIVPDWFQIILIVGSLFSVGVVANIIGGAKQQEVHIRETDNH